MTDPRSKICAATAGLIAENGYASTSIQEVADAVGITKAGVYHYFRNKLALYETIALETLSDMLATVQKAVAQAHDHEGRLVAFMCAHAAFFEETGRAIWQVFSGLAARTTGNTQPPNWKRGILIFPSSKAF
ncbi:TetR/AcrR family transcriptional regulator [Roseinatronobacter sp. S2]|uniref:TetR/AcrR family transcriptional regulator n=1 Tax=Roseinatronobacter sp. S2 TaxID=3035471 RepID=UPI0024101602|nr:TetR/AcrR family transcriptional regulator [Roseinatronobacter sp. S2]WFE76974.1 TetR/AcrR family transcriptional regulator [Roseinatronobacter sp. S2]